MFKAAAKSNYHTHTTFCDGSNTVEELVLEAIALGCKEIGFTGHSYTFFDESYCMSKAGTEEYKKEVLAMREKYKDNIKVLLGIEQDYYSDMPTDGYDYVIGSVHYVKKDGAYLPVDEDIEWETRLVNQYYGGDFYTFVEDYYKTVADVYNKTRCDIIGHFDLITKFNENGEMFDQNNPRYITARDKAIEKLMETPAAFEINTGAVAKGYRKEPFPERAIIERLKAAGKTIIVNSDCHDRKFLLFDIN